MVFQNVGAYIDHSMASQNDADITGFHRMYFNIVFKVVSPNYGQGWSVAELETLSDDVCEFKHKVVNLILPVAAFGLVTLKFQLLDQMLEEMLMFEISSVWDASQ